MQMIAMEVNNYRASAACAGGRAAVDDPRRRLRDGAGTAYFRPLFSAPLFSNNGALSSSNNFFPDLVCYNSSGVGASAPFRKTFRFAGPVCSWLTPSSYRRVVVLYVD
ncbi:hypothetical protein EVAR_11107_1 [Eumeta japonica]|uniref:Uncharacterized protein n=1 Tax=Eumeta variegata TaxID=151549 RepID=A0A4C1U5F5_EUMVA|nr:hypothetical protein EVAR_11107_1 [Eumeta japonica]